MSGRLVVTIMMVAFVKDGLGRRNAADPHNTEDQQNREDDQHQHSGKEDNRHDHRLQRFPAGVLSDPYADACRWQRRVTLSTGVIENSPGA